MCIIPLLSQVDLRFFILFVAQGKSVKLLFVLIFVELVGQFLFHGYEGDVHAIRHARINFVIVYASSFTRNCLLLLVLLPSLVVCLLIIFFIRSI